MKPIMPLDFYVVVNPEGVGVIWLADYDNIDEDEMWKHFYESEFFDVDMSDYYADQNLPGDEQQWELAEDFLKARGWRVVMCGLFEIEKSTL